MDKDTELLDPPPPISEPAKKVVGTRAEAEIKKLEQPEADYERELQARDTSTPKVLAVMVVFGFFAVLFWLLLFGLKTDSIEVVLMLVGALITAFITVLSYHFGSSAGSSRKTEAILSKSKEGQS